MAELRRFRDDVELIVADEVRRAQDPRGLVGVDEESQTEIVRTDIDVGGLDRLVETIVTNHDCHDPAMDKSMVVELHQLLPLTRRQAADRRLWAWLGLVRYPHLVAHRWEPSGEAKLRSVERFVGGRVRQTVARLWWAAELTVREGSDYSLTRDLFGLSGFQDVYEAIFGRAFCQYEPAMTAFVAEVGAKSEGVVRETAKELGYVLTTLALEALSESELRIVLADLVDRVEARLQ